MYQGNAQRSGETGCAVLPLTFGQAFTPLSLATEPAGAPAIDANGLIYVCDASASGTLYCVGATGTMNWNAAAGVQITSNGPLIGPDGTIYVAGSSLVAFTPQAGSATQRFSHAMGTGLVCSGPMALSADGSTIYVAAANSSSGSGAILALTLPATAGARPTQAWIANLSGQVNSGVALAAGGTLYAGGTSGQLFSVSATGIPAVAANGASGCAVATPAVGGDGTVHYLCLDPQQFKTALYAYQPSQPALQKSFTPSSSSLTIANGPGAAPAIAPGGSVYVSIDRLYKLAWSTTTGYIQTWAGNPATDHGATPGAPVIDSAGAVAVFGSDNWLVSYSAAGALAWNQSFGAANPYLALTAAGSVVFLQGGNVAATKFGGNPILNALNAALTAAATPAAQGNYVYPLTTVSLTDAALYALVTGFLGAPASLSLTGSLVYTGLALTLTGSTVWAPAAASPVAVTATLTFTAEGSVIALGSSATAGTNFNLGQAIPNLAGAFWGQLTLDQFNITQSASTAQAATGWNATASVALGGSLAVAASLFTNPPASVTVSGPICIDDAGNPTVALTASATFTLGGTWKLPPLTLALRADSEPDQGLIVSTIELSVQTAVAGQQVTLYANVPASAGTVTLAGQFDTPLAADSVKDLVSWLEPGLASGLTSALPPGIGTSQFGLSLISATIIPSSLNVASARVVFTAPPFTIFSVSSPGVSLTLSGATAFATVFDPFGTTPTYSVRLSGQIVLDVSSSPVLTIEADVAGPDWTISGTLAPGSPAVSPGNAIAAMGGATPLPTGTPSSNFGIVRFSAQPQYGTYSVGFIGTDTWTLFTIGDFTATFGNFSLLVDRIIADPTTNAGLVTVDIHGVLTLAGTPLGLIGSVNSQGDWQFGAVLGNAIALPSIGQLVGAVSSTLEGDLPASITDLGNNIYIRSLALSLGSAGTNSLALDIGSDPGWEGWTILPKPFVLALTDANAKIALDSAASPAASALIEGTFAIGTGGAGLRVQVPLPFSSAQFTITLVSNPGGVPVPTIGNLIGYFSAPLAQSLPSAISNLGSNISVTQFSVALQPAPTSQTVVQFQVGAPTAQWSPIGLSNLSLSDLGLGGTVTFASSTSTQITVTGTLMIGSTGIALIATATDFNNFTLGTLNGGPTQLPTVGDFISLASTSWESALPSKITALGSGLDLQQFALTKASASSSATIQVGATFSWQPIPDFSCVSFTGFTLNFNYASATGWNGSLAMNLNLFGQPGTISASMPGLQFQGTVDMGDSFNVQTVCQSILGSSSSAPTWLQTIGIERLTGTVNLGTPPYSASIGVTLDESINIGFLGSLDNMVVSANFGGGKSPSVCLTATWCPPGGAQVSGTFCYPFKKFKLPGGEDVEVPDDPPEEPPAPDPIPAGSAGTIAGTIGAGASVASIASSFLSWVFGGGSSRQTQQNADTTCAQGAVISFGANPTALRLSQTIQALMQAFPDDNTTALAQALYNGAAAVTPTPVGLTDSQIAAALESGMTTATTASLVGAAVLQIWPDETPEQMVAALGAAPYPAAAVGPALQSLYPTGTDACITAAAVYAALEQPPGLFTNADVMTGLYNCGFSASACVPLFTSVTTASAMAPLLASAGFSALNAALALYSQYPTDVATAAGMVGVLTAESAYGSLASTVVWPCLYNVGYPAPAVLTEMKTEYPSQYVTAAQLAADAVIAGYHTVQIAAPLANLYALTATSLSVALLSARPALSSTSLMTALNAALFSAVEAAVAFFAEAPTYWSTENNAQGLANALATGGYPAFGILSAEKVQFSASVGTALAACQILHNTNVVTKVEAQNALLAFDFKPSDVTNAVNTTY